MPDRDFQTRLYMDCDAAGNVLKTGWIPATVLHTQDASLRLTRELMERVTKLLYALDQSQGQPIRTPEAIAVHDAMRDLRPYLAMTIHAARTGFRIGMPVPEVTDDRVFQQQASFLRRRRA